MQDRWALAYQNTTQPEQIHWIHPPPGRFYADPFLVEQAGQPWVLFEEYEGATQKGHISASPLLDWNPQPIMQPHWHMSYPTVVQHDGELFCIPEQHQANNVTLYRCLEFPIRWQAETILLDGFAGVDPTVIWSDGSWWMWVGDQHRRARDRCFLFHAPQLTGPWREHRQSPAIQRTDLARPGGQLWLHNGQLLRPVQNRTRTYGGALAVYAINRMTAEEYSETEWSRWEPDPAWPYPDGLHHVCRLPRSNWVIWDAKRLVEEL